MDPVTGDFNRDGKLDLARADQLFGVVSFLNTSSTKPRCNSTPSLFSVKNARNPFAAASPRDFHGLADTAAWQFF
jgi:hypothetical protein